MRTARARFSWLGLGLALGYAAGPSIQALLADVSPTDLTSILSAIGLALLVSISGKPLPALHAIRVDPTTVMRIE